MPWGTWTGGGGLELWVRRVSGVHGEVLESRGDANDFEIGDLFVPGLPMSRVPRRPGRSWTASPRQTGDWSVWRKGSHEGLVLKWSWSKGPELRWQQYMGTMPAVIRWRAGARRFYPATTSRGVAKVSRPRPPPPEREPEAPRLARCPQPSEFWPEGGAALAQGPSVSAPLSLGRTILAVGPSRVS